MHLAMPLEALLPSTLQLWRCVRLSVWSRLAPGPEPCFPRLLSHLRHHRRFQHVASCAL